MKGEGKGDGLFAGVGSVGCFGLVLNGWSGSMGEVSGVGVGGVGSRFWCWPSLRWFFAPVWGWVVWVVVAGVVLWVVGFVVV